MAMKRLSLLIIIALLTFVLGVLSHATARYFLGCYVLGECEYVDDPKIKAEREEERRKTVYQYPMCGCRPIPMRH